MPSSTTRRIRYLARQRPQMYGVTSSNPRPDKKYFKNKTISVLSLSYAFFIVLIGTIVTIIFSLTVTAARFKPLIYRL
jgi:hypothetical protein